MFASAAPYRRRARKREGPIPGHRAFRR